MDDVIRPMAKTRATAGGIPLELGPLLSPYGQYKHLSLRIERVPDRARLSKGRNNADHTWSLTPDDLEGLIYFPPEGVTKAHTIALRIINLDGEYGATLAMLDFPIEPKKALPPADATPDGAADPAHSAALGRLRDEIVGLQAALAQREAALTDAQQKLDHASGEGLKQKIAAEVGAAQATWRAELEKRLADAATQAAAKLEQSRATWQVEQQARLAKSEALAKESVAEARRRGQQEAEASLAKAQQAWQTGEAQRLAAAETKWRDQAAQTVAAITARAEQAEAGLAQARTEADALRNRGKDPELAHLRNELGAAQAALSERDAAMTQARAEIEALRNRGEDPQLGRLRNELAAAQAALSEHEAAMAQARAEAEALRNRGEDPELARLRNELAAAQADLSEREAALAQARSAANQAGQQAMAQAQVALNKAAETWKANEAKRLAEAEARWREQSAQALAKATARAERAENDLAHARSEAEPGSAQANVAELARLRDDLAAVQAVLSQREIELLEARQRGGPINAAELRQAVEAELAAARSAWDLELEKRLADAALQAKTTLEQSRAAWEAEHQKRGGGSKANVQAQIQQALQAAQQEHKAALAKAGEVWKSTEAGRLAEAEAKWRQQSEQALPEAGARVERAESALAAARAQAAPPREQRDDAELLRLRGELAAMQTALAERDAALAQAREAAEQARATTPQKAEATSSKPEESRKPEAPQPPIVLTAEPRSEAPRNNMRGRFSKTMDRQRRAMLMRYAVRGGALAASLAIAALVYPRAKAMVEGAPARIAAVQVAVAAAIEPYFAAPPEPPPPPAPEPVAVAEPRWVIAATTATVRAGPSPAAGLVATLPRDIEVSPVEHRGVWVLIRFGGENGNHVREGWVTRSLLKEETDN